MSHRTFQDRDGHRWEVVDRSSSEWEFRPAGENPHSLRRVRPPGYEKDPYELSSEELQRLLDGAESPASRPRRSPFRD
jgi:hypothetical protein